MATIPGLQELPVPHAELVRYIADNTDKSMVEIIEPYRKYEAQLRSVFAQDRNNPALDDPHINVLPLFTNDTKLITTRARNLEAETQKEKDCYIMSLPDDKRRAHGSPAVVADLQEFRKNFTIFSESSLADMDWNNVVAAGSSVVNCVLPVPKEFNTTKRKLREYYHEKFCPASDVDLFLYGLTHDEAIEKIKQIERAIRDAILTEVTVVRTKYAITIASQYPTRHVQIVLRVYKSIGEILTGFDIDAAGGAYDGTQVYVTPRALGSFITQINHIDLSRRSPSYENRLSKYSHRNFEVYWSELDRSRIDPTIFERSFQRTLGLARLLILERLPTSSARDNYTNKRREERGRPAFSRIYFNRLGGDIKANHEDEVADWIDESEVSNYHTFSVPYGKQFHAKKIEKLCYTRDLLLNAEWNQPKERQVYLHRHPAFFGRVQDVIEDCCGTCPQPVTPDEKEEAQKEAEIYISGKVSFLIDDPGRQQIGSFNPLTADDWTDMAYIGNTARLCQSIVEGDIDDVLNWLSQEGSDPNKRDYTGRSPLHLAVITSTSDIVRCLVDHGARITARLADGRTALHLAAERGDAEIIKILMEKSIANEEEEEEKQARLRKAKFGDKIDGSTTTKKAEGVDSDESKEEEDSDGEVLDGAETDIDQHSIATGSFVKVKKEEDGGNDDIMPEEPTDEPDFYKIDILSWDIPCSPLHLAIAAGHEECVRLLCDYGSDALLPVKFLNRDREPTAAILTLALALSLPLEKAQSMAELLLKLGATSAQADMNGCTAFHRYVEKADPALLDTLWDNDKAAVKTAIKHLIINASYWNCTATAPLHTAIGNNDSILVLKLLNAGANPSVDFETWLKAAKMSPAEKRLSSLEENKKMFNRSVEQPLMVALKVCPDPQIALRLLESGADPNCMTQKSHILLIDNWQQRYYSGETALDVVQAQLKKLREYTTETLTDVEPQLAAGMNEYLEKIEEGTYRHWIVAGDIKAKRDVYAKSKKNYDKKVADFTAKKGLYEKKEAIESAIEEMEKIEKVILEKGGKPFYELHPEIDKPTNNNSQSAAVAKTEAPEKPYELTITLTNVKDITDIRAEKYLELFEASWSGDLEKIKSLTLQSWDEEKTEPPLKIAVSDMNGNNPWSLAFLRGHIHVAMAILDIVRAQYAPEEKESTRYSMQTQDEYSTYSYPESDEDDSDEDSKPQLVARVVDKKFTIENIGQVSMQVKSRTRPLEMLQWTVPSFAMENGKATKREVMRRSLFRIVLERDDHIGLKTLLDLATFHSSQKLEGDDEEATGCFLFPEEDFFWAVARGKTQALAEIIKRTGAGMPVDHLVKKTGVELKVKPRYYQGLTVYGKKRKDWANAGRNLVVKSTGIKRPPLLHAALNANIESVEWFLSDAPLRHYVEFGQSKAALNNPGVKHLAEAPGGFERAVSKWLGIQNDLIIHCAILAHPGWQACKLLKYLIQAYPAALEAKNTNGETPLWAACQFGRLEFIKILIDAGADQAVRNKLGSNILHAMFLAKPTAKRLRPVLELIDKELLEHLFNSRNNLSHNGETPLHSWVSLNTVTYNYREPKLKKAKDKEATEVLKLILSLSGGKELEMLNGAGDTPLHTAVMQSCKHVVRELLRFKPTLLFRENAVGRTPLEVARDLITAEKFVQPNTIQLPTMHNPVSSLVDKATETFIKEKKAVGDDKKMKPTAKQVVWKMCADALARSPGKRRLVSLNEANDVAKRLGEEYSSSRYFSIQARDDDEQEDEETRGEKNRNDFAVEAANAKLSERWMPDCPRCGRVHEEQKAENVAEEDTEDDEGSVADDE